MPFEDGIELLSKGAEKEQEKILIQRWIANYERPAYEEGISYEEFIKKINIKTSGDVGKKESKEEILNKVIKILGGEKNGNI